MSAQALAKSLEANDYQAITWREGSNAPLSSRFAAVQVRVARGQQKREPEWLLIEWPRHDATPATYWLSNLPEDTSLTTLMATAKGYWRIERDYQELKQAFGLKHYEGATGEGFTTMPLFVRLLTVFWSWSAYGVGIKKPAPARLPCGGS